MDKKWLIGLVSVLSIPFTLADLSGTLGNVWVKILSFGNLTFLGLSDGSVVVAFTRLLIWILLFTVFFAVLTAFNGKDGKGPFSWLNRSQAMVVAAIVATIGAVFLPASVLLATGSGWGTAIALILIGGPVAGLAYLLWLIPGEGERDTRATIFLKLLICLLLFWILSAMKFHVSRTL